MKRKKKKSNNRELIQVIALILLLLVTACKENPPAKPVPLVAKPYYSGFDLANNTYNAITKASDGQIYYVLSSKSIDMGGQVYVYNPETDQIKFLGDLTEICGEKGGKTIPQGKSHVEFYECDGKLYFATHQGYYEIIDGMERTPVHLKEPYKPYPGGHFLSYDLSSGKFEDLGIGSDNQGIITMNMDTKRKQIFAIAWPKGYFIHFDPEKKVLRNLGQISSDGEAGILGEDYRVLCRSILIDPRDGTAFYSTAEGDIFYYSSDSEKIKKLEGISLKLDYFGKYDYTRPGSMSYNWRTILWYPPEGVAYGVHGNSGYLFRFDPRKPGIELVDRITSLPSKKSGMYDQYSYGYLGFELGNNGRTLYYLTGGPIYADGRRVEGIEEIGLGGARGLENLHLVTYNIPENKYTDHGPIFYENGSRPTWINSLAIGNDGHIYTLARFDHDGKSIEDLVKIPDPFSK